MKQFTSNESKKSAFKTVNGPQLTELIPKKGIRVVGKCSWKNREVGKF